MEMDGARTEELTTRHPRVLTLSDKTIGEVIRVAKQFIPDLDAAQDFIDVSIVDSMVVLRRRKVLHSRADALRTIVTSERNRTRASASHQMFYDVVIWELWGTHKPCTFRALRIPLDDTIPLTAGLIVPKVLERVKAASPVGVGREIQVAIDMIPNVDPKLDLEVRVAKWFEYLHRFTYPDEIGLVLTVDPTSQLPETAGKGFIHLETL